MSFWSTVAKIAGIGLAPVTGGASLPIGMAVGNGIDAATKSGVDTAANVAGSMAKSGQDANNTKDARLLRQEDAQLERDKFALLAPSTRMNQTARASLLKSASPLTVNWGGPGSGLKGQIPTYSGGANSALPALSADSTPLADTVMAQNLAAQRANKDAQSPYLSQVGKTSLFDKAVGIASMGLNGLDAALSSRGGGGSQDSSAGPYSGGYQSGVPSSIAALDDTGADSAPSGYGDGAGGYTQDPTGGYTLPTFGGPIGNDLPSQGGITGRQFKFPILSR